MLDVLDITAIIEELHFYFLFIFFSKNVGYL